MEKEKKELKDQLEKKTQSQLVVVDTNRDLYVKLIYVNLHK